MVSRLGNLWVLVALAACQWGLVTPGCARQAWALDWFLSTHPGVEVIANNDPGWVDGWLPSGQTSLIRCYESYLPEREWRASYTISADNGGAGTVGIGELLICWGVAYGNGFDADSGSFEIQIWEDTVDEKQVQGVWQPVPVPPLPILGNGASTFDIDAPPGGDQSVQVNGVTFQRINFDAKAGSTYHFRVRPTGTTGRIPFYALGAPDPTFQQTGTSGGGGSGGGGSGGGSGGGGSPQIVEPTPTQNPWGTWQNWEREQEVSWTYGTNIRARHWSGTAADLPSNYSGYGNLPNDFWENPQIVDQYPPVNISNSIGNPVYRKAWEGPLKVRSRVRASATAYAGIWWLAFDYQLNDAENTGHVHPEARLGLPIMNRLPNQNEDFPSTFHPIVNGTLGIAVGQNGYMKVWNVRYDANGGSSPYSGIGSPELDTVGGAAPHNVSQPYGGEPHILPQGYIGSVPTRKIITSVLGTPTGKLFRAVTSPTGPSLQHYANQEFPGGETELRQFLEAVLDGLGGKRTFENFISARPNEMVAGGTATGGTPVAPVIQWPNFHDESPIEFNASSPVRSQQWGSLLIRNEWTKQGQREDGGEVEDRRTNSTYFKRLFGEKKNVDWGNGVQGDQRTLPWLPEKIGKQGMTVVIPTGFATGDATLDAITFNTGEPFTLWGVPEANVAWWTFWGLLRPIQMMAMSVGLIWQIIRRVTA